MATTYSPTKTAVPSAQVGLTSLFGMGRGGHNRYSHHEILNIIKELIDKTKESTLNKKKL